MEVFCNTVYTKLLPLPDHLQVFPTHVSGSLCGGNISSRLSTTMGYERRTNPILSEAASRQDADAIVRECLRLDNLPALTVDEFAAQQDAGALVLDTRAPEAFGGSHLPGALNVGLGPAFATWAGTVLPEAAGVVLVLDRSDDVWEVSWQLLRIGYPPPLGWLAGGMTA